MGVKKDRDIVDYSSCFCVFGHFLSKDDVRYLRIINKNGVEKISMNEAALPQSTRVPAIVAKRIRQSVVPRWSRI